MYSLLYSSFGDSVRIQCELIYSLLSFNKVASSWSKDNIQIVVYTDSEISFPDMLSSCKISVKYIEKQDIKDWIEQSNGFKLIVKTKVLKDCLSSFNGSVLLVDTDTFFMRDPKQLFDKIQTGNLVMHLKEYTLQHRPLITAFFEKKASPVSDHYALSDIHQREMWNSGVVGLNSDYLPLVDQVILLTEQISNVEGWPQEEWHIIEQLSFSCLFQEKGNILPAEEVIVHYWFFKAFRFMLAKQLNYFHLNDFNDFSIIAKERNVHQRYLEETLPYASLPFLLVELLKNYTDISQIDLDVLPAHTYIGDILRKSIC